MKESWLEKIFSWWEYDDPMNEDDAVSPQEDSSARMRSLSVEKMFEKDILGYDRQRVIQAFERNEKRWLFKHRHQYAEISWKKFYESDRNFSQGGRHLAFVFFLIGLPMLAIVGIFHSSLAPDYGIFLSAIGITMSIFGAGTWIASLVIRNDFFSRLMPKWKRTLDKMVAEEYTKFLNSPDHMKLCLMQYVKSGILGLRINLSDPFPRYHSLCQKIDSRLDEFQKLKLYWDTRAENEPSMSELIAHEIGSIVPEISAYATARASLDAQMKLVERVCAPVQHHLELIEPYITDIAMSAYGRALVADRPRIEHEVSMFAITQLSRFITDLENVRSMIETLTTSVVAGVAGTTPTMPFTEVTARIVAHEVDLTTQVEIFEREWAQLPALSSVRS